MQAPTKKKVDGYLKADIFCPWCDGENLTSHMMDDERWDDLKKYRIERRRNYV